MDSSISSTPISGTLSGQPVEIFLIGLTINRVLTFTLQVVY